MFFIRLHQKQISHSNPSINQPREFSGVGGKQWHIVGAQCIFVEWTNHKTPAMQKCDLLERYLPIKALKFSISCPSPLLSKPVTDSFQVTAEISMHVQLSRPYLLSPCRLWSLQLKGSLCGLWETSSLLGRDQHFQLFSKSSERLVCPLA